MGAEDSAAFFVLTNTRSLSPEDAATRNREVVRALHEAAAAEGTGYVLASRSDSALRGHFPLETDALAEELTRLDVGAPDGVVLVPAYIEAGRLTVGSRHWMRTADGLLPVGESEFARDATFGYGNSSPPEWVEEKTGASGLPVEELHGALARGVAKVNVNAELRRACLEAVRMTLPSALPGSDAVSLWAAGRDAVRDAALEIIGA